MSKANVTEYEILAVRKAAEFPIDASHADVLAVLAEKLTRLGDRRCATCRWAVAGVEGKGKNRDEFLECTHAWTAGAIAGMDGGYCDAGHRIEVAPDFGCVQWEGK